MIRDFSDEAENTLRASMTGIASDNYRSIPNWFSYWGEYQSIAAKVGATPQFNSINSYHVSVLNECEDSIQNMTKVFTKARGIDADYGGKLSACAPELEDLITLLRETANVISPGNGIHIPEEMLTNLSALYGQLIAETSENVQETTFLGKLWASYGWAGLLGGTNYISKIYGFSEKIKNAANLEELMKTGKDLYDFVSKAVTTFKNYKQIGRAVGGKTAFTWWLKNITGLKPLGRASEAKNVFTNFKNNLTNKTSPFNAQLRGVVDDFKGVNGTGKAVAAWGTVIISGITNTISNIQEYKDSDGKMTKFRAGAEIVTETAVDTAMTFGLSSLVGAGVTTVATALGVACPPAALVVAASGLIITGANVACEHFLGKSLTETISDFALDTVEFIGEAVVTGAKKAGVLIYAAGTAIAEGVEYVADKVADTAREVKDAVVEGAKELKEDVDEFLDDVGDAVSDIGSGIKTGARNAFKSTSNWFKGLSFG